MKSEDEIKEMRRTSAKDKLKLFCKWCLLFITITMPVALLVFGFGITLIVTLQDIYCKHNPSIIMDDMCFSIDARCEFECQTYDRNFTGNIDTTHCECCCDCGDILVSVCSGFAYQK